MTGKEVRPRANIRKTRRRQRTAQARRGPRQRPRGRTTVFPDEGQAPGFGPEAPQDRCAQEGTYLAVGKERERGRCRGVWEAGISGASRPAHSARRPVPPEHRLGGPLGPGASGPPAAGRPGRPCPLPVVPHRHDEEEQEGEALDGGQEEEVVVEVAAVDVAWKRDKQEAVSRARRRPHDVPSRLGPHVGATFSCGRETGRRLVARDAWRLPTAPQPGCTEPGPAGRPRPHPPCPRLGACGDGPHSRRGRPS